MAVFNPGTSSLSSVTYESALVEAIALYRRHLMTGSRSNPTFSISQNGTAITGLSSIALSVSTGSSGAISLSAVDETSGFTWVSDSTSDATATSLPAQIIALATAINEGTPLTGETVDRVTVSVNIDNKLAQVSLNLAAEIVDVDDPSVSLSLSVHDYIEDFE
jgi:hypothetical protein